MWWSLDRDTVPAMEGYTFWPASLLAAVLKANGKAIDRRTQGQHGKAQGSVHVLI